MSSATYRLLDSSVIIKHFRQGGAYTAKLEACEELFVPNTVLAELYAGAYRSVRQEKHLAQIEEFIKGATLLHADEQTARHYGQISAQLAAQGTPIPQNDIWIAAGALQWGLTVATTDHHYGHVDGLSFEMW